MRYADTCSHESEREECAADDHEDTKGKGRSISGQLLRWIHTASPHHMQPEAKLQVLRGGSVS